MKRYRFTTLFIIILLFCASLAVAQPKATIKVEGLSPQQIHDSGRTTTPSGGLRVVGVGELVYLSGMESSGKAVTAYAWSITVKPAGSAAAVDSTATRWTTFRPDVVGQFTVKLAITTADGAAEATIVITSAKYVGVGGIAGLPVNTGKGQCAYCHFTNTDQWKKTGHSTYFTRAIDGKVLEHYNSSCIECHVVGHNTEPAAMNDGFDDVAKTLGWTFPAALQDGNWANMVANYPDLAQMTNIQCENCHGPGSQHLGDKTKTDMTLSDAPCSRCHEKEPYYRQATQWRESRHAHDIGATATRAGCDACHSGWGFIRKIDPKTPDNRPTNGFGIISCSVCHDPHRSELPAQVRSLKDVTLGDGVTVVNYGGKGKLCMQCHIGRRPAEEYASNPANISTHFGPHYSNQADMIDGANAIEYGVPIGSSGHKFAARDACVTCHMAATAGTGMPGRDKIGEHTFAMRWDNGTPDDHSDDIENVGVCQPCHGPITSFHDIMANADYDEDGTIESVPDEVHGLLERLGNLLPPAGPSVVLTKADYDWTGKPPAEAAKRQLLLKAAFNYLYVEEDASSGIHNTSYAVALLRRSIMSLTTGDIGAGDILSIKDVPNDQGKQVRLTWSKFVGDGLSNNPVTGYAIWRKVKDGMAMGAKKVDSKKDMIVQANAANVGSRFVTEHDGMWDFIKYLPASGHEMYSTIVPTLFDSTAAGPYWSVFYVSGFAQGVIYETAPDSGYSIDNLVPTAPMNVSAMAAGNMVSLKWDDPTDEDFNYFAVYRGTESGFNPKGTTPVMTLTATAFADMDVAQGSTYYYKVSAFDFSGNESEFSAEIAVAVTSVDSRNAGVPTDFALHQNYPNPFNPSTSIQFDLPKAEQITLKVYNLQGVLVKTLAAGRLSEGYHTFAWDGTNESGAQVSAGPYIYRLETPTMNLTKKMIFLK